MRQLDEASEVISVLGHAARQSRTIPEHRDGEARERLRAAPDLGPDPLQARFQEVLRRMGLLSE